MARISGAEKAKRAMNKLEEVEALTEELKCDYEVAFNLAYDIPGDPYDTSTDDAL